MTSAVFKNYAYAGKALTSENYDYIYLSPHCDDVAFSCSGTICSQKVQGLQVLVATLFAGDPQPPFSPVAQVCHQFWQIPEGVPPYQIRRQEDEKAMRALEVDYVWLSWLDSIYRLPDLADFSALNNGESASQDDPVFPLLQQWLGDLCAAYPSATMVVPLGVGKHRDHRLVFEAALPVLDRAKLLFFEDFPYAAYLPQEPGELAQPYQLTSFEVDISAWLEQRMRAAAFYQSQHSMLFYPPSALRDTIRAYTSQGDGQQFVERYWRFPQ